MGNNNKDKQEYWIILKYIYSKFFKTFILNVFSNLLIFKLLYNFCQF